MHNLPRQYPSPINGASGAIETLWQPVDHPRQNTQGLPYVAVLCHPHPLYGGTMHNKVVHTLARVLRDHDIPVLRFNFRGVGNSDGVFSNGVGECVDLLTVVQQLQQQEPSAVILGGFSFGAYVTALAVQRLTTTVICEHMLLIAPPVGKPDYDFPQYLPCRHVHIVQGTEDEIVTVESVQQWVQNIPQASISMLRSGHFFHRKLTDLKHCLQQFLATCL